MKRLCIVLLFSAIAGCSESRAPAPRVAVPAATMAAQEKRRAPSAGEPADGAPADSAPVAAAAIEESSGEIDSALAQAHPDRAKAMLTAAKKALLATQATYDVGTNTLANLHLWSRHVVLAERALARNKEEELAALVDYWKRSRQTYLKVRALYNTGTRGGEVERFAAAAYYLAEAELWIEAAGGTVPAEPDSPDNITPPPAGE